jgi:cytochrome c biogenesis protein CcmG, thiol:disulfide interchange protein DsbE
VPDLPHQVAAPLAGLLLAGLVGLSALQFRAPAPPSPVVGEPAPAFSLPRLDDGAATLSPARLRGQVWVLNVWASWCAPCRDEHPLLVALAREHGLPMLGLNYKDDPRDAQEWLRRLGDPYVATALDRDGRTGADYGVQGVPVSFVIDSQGLVRHRHVGPLTRQAWQQDLLPLIRSLQVSTPHSAPL